MKTILNLVLASAACLPLCAAKPRIPFTHHGVKDMVEIVASDGTVMTNQNGVAVMTRKNPGRHLFFRAMVKLKPKFTSDFAPADMLVVRLKTEKDTKIRVRWRKTDKTFIDAPVELAIKGAADFQDVYVPLPKEKNKNYQLLFLEFFPEPDKIAFERLAISDARKVTVELCGNPAKVQQELHVSGVTASPSADVTVTVCNSAGKTFSKTVRSQNGRYELKWKRPPINIYRWNSVSASVNGGKSVADRSIDYPVFGYYAKDDHVWLRVKGRDIVTSELAQGGEQRFIPVGVGYARDVIIPAQDEELMKFCRARGLNTIRLAFYTRFFNNRDSEPLNIDEHIRDFILPVVRAAKRHNMYVILDDHGYFTAKIDEAKARQQQKVPRWSEEGFNEWIARWRKVAEFFKNEPNVLGYELLNEPHDISPEMTAKWYTRCLKAIREVDQRHIVLMGTCDWSHARALERTWGKTAKTVDAPYNNVVFSFHDYPEDNHPWDVQRSITAFMNKYNVPVMCTEFGATHWNKSETVCRMFQSGMFAVFAKENVGWMIWAIGRLKDSPRSPYNEVDKVNVKPPRYDSVAYSDQWIPTAKVMGSPFPKEKKNK